MLSKDRKDGSECEMVTFLGVYRMGAREEIVLRWNGSPSACLTILHQKGEGSDDGTPGALHRKDRQALLLSRW